MPRGAGAALVVLVAAGAVLRLWQCFANTSLWIDEIALAENVLNRPLHALLVEPLALDQVAPPGFLAATKLTTELFGSSELALRLVPLLSGLGALVLFPLLSRRFQPPWITVFATGVFALAPTLIAHGAEFKPYSTDVLAAVALTLAAFDLAQAGASGRLFTGAALLGAAAVWFSQGAVFVVAGIGAALTLIAVRERRFRSKLAATLAVWAASAGAAVASGIHRVPPQMRAYLDRFWQPALPKPGLLLFVAVAAMLLWIRDRRSALLLFGPVAFTLAAAAAHLYPFSGRAVLFLAPAAILAIAEAAAWLVEGLARLRVPRPVGASMLAAGLVANLLHDPPVYRNEDARPVLQRLARRRQPGDTIYVFYPGQRAFGFYGPRVGLSKDGVVSGLCHRADPRGYLRELDRLRGRHRVWVFRTHVSERLAEAPLLDGYLARLGNRVETIEGEDTEASLWDLTRSDATADLAESFPLPARDTELAGRFGCDHGPIGVAPWDDFTTPGTPP